MAKQIVRGKLGKVKVEQVVAKLKKHTVGETAAFFGVSAVALYKKFGDSIKGIRPLGKAPSKKATKKVSK